MAVKLKGPADHGGFGFRGESFLPDEDGHIDVPHEALDEAFSHGFAYPADGADVQDVGQGDEPKAAKKKK